MRSELHSEKNSLIHVLPPHTHTRPCAWFCAPHVKAGSSKPGLTSDVLRGSYTEDGSHCPYPSRSVFCLPQPCGLLYREAKPLGSQPLMKSSVRTLASRWKNTLWKAGQLMAAGRVTELQVAKGPVFGHFPCALSRFYCLLGHEVCHRQKSLETTGHKQTVELGRELKETQTSMKLLDGETPLPRLLVSRHFAAHLCREQWTFP